jgi:hypothetical protein
MYFKQGETMNRNAIRIACVLDKSGSMTNNRESTMTSFNNFINALKGDTHGTCQFKLIQFDTNYSITFDKPLANIAPLTRELYAPGDNMTALLDAQGRCIDEIGAELRALAEPDRPGKVIILTVTDGLENSSKHYTHGQLSEMIEHQQKVYNWDFFYLGANQDAIKVGSSLNIARNRSMTYSVSDPAALASAFGASANAINTVRSHAVSGQSTTTVGFSEQERNAAAGNLQSITGKNASATNTTKDEPAVSSR